MRILVVFAVIFFLNGHLQAAGLSSKPILRIETGHHLSIISSIATNDSGRFVVTGSSDKTVRIWALPNGRLLRVLRLPISDGFDGRIYSVAMSPDGNIVAVGGWLQAGSKQFNVFLFDRVSGRLLQRLKGLEDVIHNLEFSPNGQYLAAAIGGTYGVRVWRTMDWKLVMEDKEYGAPTHGLSFNPSGGLATSSFDGYVRLYDKQFQIFAGEEQPENRSHDGGPADIAFSPDGSRLAVSHLKIAGVSVLSSQDLSPVYFPNVSGINGMLKSIIWSKNGDYLYAGGLHENKGKNAIRRWSKRGRGRFKDFLVADNTLMDLEPLNDADVLYAAGDPAFGALNSRGKKFLDFGPSVIDMWGKFDQFLVSNDGSVIQFVLDQNEQKFIRFDIRQPQKNPVIVNPKDNHGLKPPITSLSGLDIEGWMNTRFPKLKGKPLRLWRRKFKDETSLGVEISGDFQARLFEAILQKREREISRSLAIAPNGRRFILGAEASLNLFDNKGKRLWKQRTPVPVALTNISGNGKIAVAAMVDGTVHWYRMKDGKKILSLFLDKKSEEWVMWTPKGYYISSPGGDKFIGWHLNNGPDQEADFYTALQFERILYRPDYVQDYFQSFGNSQKAAQVLTDKDFDVNDLSSIAPPKIELLSPMDGDQVFSNKVKLKIAVEKRSLPMLDYTVFVNDIPVTPSAERILRGNERNQFTRRIEIPISETENRIRVEVFNGTSMGIAEMVLYRPKPSPTRKGNLYLLAVGASQFLNLTKENNLDFAAIDAESFAEFFQTEKHRQFNRVFIKTISDNSRDKPYKRNILKALTFVKQARMEDTVIVFLASHGLSDRAGNYYFVPTDALANDINSILDGRKGKRTSLVSWEAFFDALRSTAGRRLLLVDTCQAKNIAGTLDFHSLAKRSASSSFALMAASKGDEESQEYPPGKHGLFTYAILKGLSGDADRTQNKNRQVSLVELFEFTQRFVQNKKLLKHLPQTPQMLAPNILRNMILRHF